MNWRFAVPVIGVLVAILITGSLDANGLTAYSALPLFPLLVVFWLVDRLRRRDAGFTLGKPRDYLLALLYPAIVLGIVTAIAVSAGGKSVETEHLNKALKLFWELALSTVIVAIVTEEGFFRGWLWGSLRKRGVSVGVTLACTSIAFAAWHISYVTLAHGYTLPPLQVVLFITNAAIIGAIWGLMRALSGSVVVSSVSHGLWNGVAYAFFGEGPKSGPLGLPNTIFFGPEIGVIGLVANALFFVCLLAWVRRSGVLNATGSPGAEARTNAAMLQR